MAYLLVLWLFSVAGSAGYAQTPYGSLQVQVIGARNAKGVVLCSVFKDGKGYPDQPLLAFAKASGFIAEGRVMLDFDSLPAGQYAVALLHDENGDKKMNTSLMGLPKEGYGFSNNVMGLFGPPSFSKASVNIANGKKKIIKIELRY
ncbi:MAG: DUF2141 domain-containing protein [Sphingomonadales bacterium]